MSSYSERMATGLEVSFERFGVAAVYTDKEGYNTDCTVIVDRELQRYGDVAVINGKQVVIAVRASEVELKPRRGETFLVNDCESFVVDSVLSSDGAEHKCLAA